MTKLIRSLDILSELKPGKHKCWCEIISNPFSQAVRIPVIIAKGPKEGKILGITAAVHGNEINGIPVIQRLFKNIDCEKINGAIIGVPVVNIPSFERKRRRFVDGRDLNHQFPGKEGGNNSEVYASRVFTRIIRHFNFLLDLHTASFGRINSYYIRADLSDPTTKRMAILQNAQIIVNNPPNDGTLRGAAEDARIPAITLEVGNPNTFQRGVIRSSLTGIYNTLHEFGIYETEIDDTEDPPIMCKDSFWIYTQEGGVLNVMPHLADPIEKGQEIAILKDIFGQIINRYEAPESGVVVGKSISPINISGGRILHLGRKYKE